MRIFSPDESSLPVIPCSRSLRRFREVPPFFRMPGGGEARCEALERLRTWLLGVAGSQAALELLLGLIDEQLSYEEAASMLQVNKGTVWQLVRHAWNAIRWAAVAERAVAECERGSGFTIDPRTALPVTRSDRDCFAVSLAGSCEEVAEPSVEAVRSYLCGHANRFLRKRRKKVNDEIEGGDARHDADAAPTDLTDVLPIGRAHVQGEETADPALEERRLVYLGGWRPEAGSPLLVLDLTVLIADEAEARAFAHSQRQYAIFNFRTQEEIVVRPKSRRATRRRAA